MALIRATKMMLMIRMMVSYTRLLVSRADRQFTGDNAFTWPIDYCDNSMLQLLWNIKVH